MHEEGLSSSTESAIDIVYIIVIPLFYLLVTYLLGLLILRES